MRTYGVIFREKQQQAFASSDFGLAGLARSHS
jgi:hypothetical protein